MSGALFANALGNPRTRRLVIVAASILFVLTFLYSASDTTYASNVKSKLPSWQGSFSTPTSTSSSSPSTITLGKVEPILLDKHCSTLPGAEDVLLVMKTGSSVIDKRLPVHFKTTFKCTPDFLVFSDMAQDFHGLQIHDALSDLHKYVDMSSPSLKYYEYLKKQGQRKAQGSWWPDKAEKFETKESDAAWEMDKYKNIPILRQSYAMYPEKKWFLFVDADTSVMWANILTWLAQLDHTKPFYTGSQNWIGDVEFAHGGSGYIVSQAAVRILADETEEKAKEHISFAEHECCGDMVLAHAFHDNNIALNGSWPNIQGSRPDTLDYDSNKWCHAAMTFHHTTPEQTEQLWKLDRASAGVKNITYSDIFWSLIQPLLLPSKPDWDNGAEDTIYPPKRNQDNIDSWRDTSTWDPSSHIERNASKSFEGCREACKDDKHCFQFAFRANRTSEGQNSDEWPHQCGLRRAITLGEKVEVKDGEEHDEGWRREGVTSGWDLERIEMWARKHVNNATGKDIGKHMTAKDGQRITSVMLDIKASKKSSRSGSAGESSDSSGAAYQRKWDERGRERSPEVRSSRRDWGREADTYRPQYGKRSPDAYNQRR